MRDCRHVVSYIACNRIWVCLKAVNGSRSLLCWSVRASRSISHSNKWEIIILSCFSSTSYNLAAVPFARTNSLNQIMVRIPIVVVKLLQSMCRKISGLLSFHQRRWGTAVWPVSSVCSAKWNMHSLLQRWQMLMPSLPTGVTQFSGCNGILYTRSEDAQIFFFFLVRLQKEIWH